MTSSTENRWSLILENIVTALKALPFPDGTVIEKIVRAAGVDALIGDPAIGVCMVHGDRWVLNASGTPGSIGDHENENAEMLIQIAIRADSAREPMDALDGVGGIGDLSRIALKVRNIDVGIYGRGNDLDTGGVFLDGVRSDLVEFPGREPGGAGPLTKIFTLKTTTLPL
jgi:hypothetical protein